MKDRVALVGHLALTVAVVVGQFLPETPPACRTHGGPLLVAFAVCVGLASVISVASVGMRLVDWDTERRARRRR